MIKTRLILIQKIEKTQEFISKIIRVICAILLSFLMISILIAVISRYVFFVPLNFSDQLSKYLLIWVAFLGGSLLFHTNENIALGLFTTKMPQEIQRIIMIVTNFLILIFLVVCIKYGWNFALTGIKYKDPLLLNVSLFYPYFSIPFCLSVIAFQLLMETLKKIFGEEISDEG